MFWAKIYFSNYLDSNSRRKFWKNAMSVDSSYNPYITSIKSAETGVIDFVKLYVHGKQNVNRLIKLEKILKAMDARYIRLQRQFLKGMQYTKDKGRYLLKMFWIKNKLLYINMVEAEEKEKFLDIRIQTKSLNKKGIEYSDSYFGIETEQDEDEYYTKWEVMDSWIQNKKNEPKQEYMIKIEENNKVQNNYQYERWVLYLFFMHIHMHVLWIFFFIYLF